MIPGGCHTNHRHGVSVQQYRLIEDAGIATEAGLPIVVSENYYGMGAGKQVVVDREAAAQRGIKAERVEPGAANEFRLDPLTAIVVAEVEGSGEARGHIFEDGVMVAKIPIHRVRESVLAPNHAALRTRAGERDQLSRVLHRDEAQQNLVRDGEHGTVRPDAKREREEGDDGEQRASPQIAYRVKKILQHP